MTGISGPAPTSRRIGSTCSAGTDRPRVRWYGARVSEGFRVIAIADVEPVSVVSGTLDWRPLRRTLGVRAFGINAYTAAEAGRDVVEEHTEETLGHEEIYVVLSGRATF